MCHFPSPLTDISLRLYSLLLFLFYPKHSYYLPGQSPYILVHLSLYAFINSNKTGIKDEIRHKQEHDYRDKKEKITCYQQREPKSSQVTLLGLGKVTLPLLFQAVHQSSAVTSSDWAYKRSNLYTKKSDLCYCMSAFVKCKC